MSDDESERSARREYHFNRRKRAAVAGRHLPTLAELILDCPFLSADLSIDAQIFAERVLPRITAESADSVALVDALKALTLGASEPEDFRRAAGAFRTVSQAERPGLKSPDPQVCALRCDYYAAACGCFESAGRIAAEAMSMVYNGDDDTMIEVSRSASGWLMIAAIALPTARRRFNLPGWGGWRDHARSLGKHVIEGMLRAWESSSAKPVRKHEGSAGSLDQQPEETLVQSLPDDEADHGVIVCSNVSNPETSEGKRVAKEFSTMLGKRMKLVPLPDLAAVRRTLADEFPHASIVVDRLLERLVGRSHVYFGPVILVGPPGCGKTTFSERLLTELGVHHETFSCGGISDSALAGTARRWSTGEPSLPLSLIRRYATASPGIVLDEIEKVATGRHNGHLLDATLAYWESQTAGCWHDPYLGTAVNLAHVIWIGTANSMAGIPVPLRDRARVIQFPNPGPEHLAVLATSLLRKAIIARGLDARWARPIDRAELDALQTFWPGGSIRKLAKLVDGVILAREHIQDRH